MLFNSLSLIGSNPSSHGFKSAGALKDNVEIIHILHSTHYTGGFQLEFVSISWLINQMNCEFECSYWWKIYI